MKESAMFTRVLVPLDGSALAQGAVPYALALADADDGLLTLFQAVPPLHVTWDYNVPYDAAIEAERLTSAEKCLGAIAQRLREAPRQIETQAAVGDPADEILAYTERMAQVLIVMATHGYGGILHWAFGSVARRVLTAATVPMLIVRPKEPPAQPGRPAPIRNILVPLDGSKRAEAVLPLVRDLAPALGAQVTLVRIVAVPPPGYVVVPNLASPPAPTRTATGEAWMSVEAYLQQVSADLASAGVTVTSLMPAGQAAAELLDLLRDGGYDLVAMTTHGRTGIKRWRMGSVAERLVEALHTPVLLLRSPGTPTSAHRDKE
jgi:nucleotide-binding universal stress UspA family protein